MYSGTVYIYVGPLGGWTPIDSGLATRHISSMTGSIASVNTAAAAEPVKQVLLNGAIPRVKFPVSICLATGRYGVEVRECGDGDPGYEEEVEGAMTVVISELPLRILPESTHGEGPDISMCVCPLIGVEVPSASAVCEKSMNDRKRAKASGDALMANSLKICANSLYGSTGNSRSVSYSPLCSMAVTGAGRWLLGVMMVSSRCSAPLAVGVVRVIIGKRRDDGTFEQGEAGRG